MQQISHRPIPLRDAIKADGKHNHGGAPPQHFKHQQHPREDADLADAGLPGRQGVPQTRLATLLQPLAGVVQTQTQEWAQQQKARRQGQGVLRGCLEGGQQEPTHCHETRPVEQTDQGRLCEVFPTRGEPAKGVTKTDRGQRPIQSTGLMRV